MVTGLYTYPEFLRHGMGPHHPGRPDRLCAIEDQPIANRVEDLLVPCGAPPTTEAQLCRVHCAEYVRELVASVPIADYMPIDPDTSMNPHTYMATVLTAGTAVDTTDKIIAGELKSTFCSVHPPGHHAEPGRAMGFCFFNNVAVATRHVLEHHDLQRMAIVDFDVHHGNDTEAAFRDEPRVLMYSIFRHPLHPYSGTETVAVNTVNVPLSTYINGLTVHEVVEAIWLPRLEAFESEMLFISVGSDAHREDDLGQTGLVETGYARITKQLIQVARKHTRGRIVSCLEGGYNLSALGRSVVAHVKALAELQVINDDNSLMSFEKAIKTSWKNRSWHVGPALYQRLIQTKKRRQRPKQGGCRLCLYA